MGSSVGSARISLGGWVGSAGTSLGRASKEYAANTVAATAMDNATNARKTPNLLCPCFPDISVPSWPVRPGPPRRTVAATLGQVAGLPGSSCPGSTPRHRESEVPGQSLATDLRCARHRSSVPVCRGWPAGAVRPTDSKQPGRSLWSATPLPSSLRQGVGRGPAPSDASLLRSEGSPPPAYCITFRTELQALTFTPVRATCSRTPTY